MTASLKSSSHLGHALKRACGRPSCRSTSYLRHNFTNASNVPAGTGESTAPTSTSHTELPNELLRIISTHIKTHGPLPLPRYIQLCLSHPTLGYYTRLERQSADGDTVIGKRGDFITSPEISQVFGELLAIWYISQWQAQGMHPKTRIIELGPGKGTLMDDMLRTFQSIRGFKHSLTDVHLVETSPYMRKQQEAKLAPYRDSGMRIHWHDKIQDVPSDNTDVYTMLVAHEFFDALPIHLFEKRPEGFREVFVDLGNAPLSQDKPPTVLVSNSSPPTKADQDPKLRFVVSPSATLASSLFLPKDDPELVKLSPGARVEVCPEAYEISAVCASLVGKRGAGLFVDYGGEQLFGNSFRAFKQHTLVDPLQTPGQADLTANVNFAFLREALTSPRLARLGVPDAVQEELPKIYVPPLQSQRSFLLSLGLNLRVNKLLERQTDASRRADIIKSAERLVEKSEKIHGMGAVFKVMGFVPRQENQATQEVFPFGLELD